MTKPEEETPEEDKDLEVLEVWNEPVWEIYDHFSAQIRGLFYSEEDADLFRKALLKHKEENGIYS